MPESTPSWGPFRADSLSWIMAGLIVIVVATVSAYSRRYLAGDRNHPRHRRDVLLLGACVLVMVFADHFPSFLAAWAASNLMLVRLMIHDGRWAAARDAGLLALRTFGVGFLLLCVGSWLLVEGSGTDSIRGINSATGEPGGGILAGLLLVAVAAMTQSAAWPFHRWLLSSLNSPTPVSALMHAGLVNGGGFLLVRFAPLYLAHPLLLRGLFAAGLVTAVVGSFWKLLQPDVKRMLACSTMGQMGFMLMQCGMGLFAPAVSHLCWHGLFKAYLFLGAGSVVREGRRAVAPAPVTPTRLIMACSAGSLGLLAFSAVSGLGSGPPDTGWFMAGLAFIAASQLAGSLLETPATWSRLIAVPLVGLGGGGLYGLSVLLVEAAFSHPHVTRPQPLDAIYAAGFGIIALAWLAVNLNLADRLQATTAWKRLYVAALNGGQPHPRTVTGTRTAYQN